MVQATDWDDITTSKWVFACKVYTDGVSTQSKARLVVRGFAQMFGADCFETFAVIPSISFIKATLAIGFHNGWSLYHLDVMQAFVRAS